MQRVRPNVTIRILPVGHRVVHRHEGSNGVGPTQVFDIKQKNAIFGVVFRA